MIFKLAKYYLSLYYWDYAPLDSIRKMQLKKFRKIFEYARQNSKFYREFYRDNGVSDLNIETYEDIQKVPVVDKALLRQYETRDIMTCDINENINIHSTSGSTGEPFKVAYSKFEDYSSHVRLTKELMMHGYTPFKKMLLLSRYDPGHHFEVESDLNNIGFLQRKLKMFRKDVVSIFNPVEDIIAELKKLKPYVVWSTPSVIHMVAIEMEKRNERLDIPLVLLMAETVSYEQLKLFKQRVCQNILDDYGCMESPSVGFSYNTIDYKNIVCNTSLIEVVNHRTINDQQVGDVIVTNLLNKSMPFIRFNVGDYVGVLDEDNFPVKKIGKVNGRFEDILTLGNKYVFTFHQTYQLFHDFHECRQYKFIQKPDGEMVLQLNIKPGANTDDVKAKAMNLWHRYYPDIPLSVEWVDNFEIDKKTGKFKVIEKLQ